MEDVSLALALALKFFYVLGLGLGLGLTVLDNKTARIVDCDVCTSLPNSCAEIFLKNATCTHHKDFHITINVLLQYAEKCECSKLGPTIKRSLHGVEKSLFIYLQEMQLRYFQPFLAWSARLTFTVILNKKMTAMDV